MSTSSSSSSISYAILIAALVASPSVIARTIHEITGDPLWRWLAIDEQGLATSETSIESDGPYVQIQLVWRGPDSKFDTPKEAALALRRAFEAKGIEPFIAVFDASAADNADANTTVALRAGTNQFGPFPIWDTSRHVQPAVLAAELAFRPTGGEQHRW